MNARELDSDALGVPKEQVASRVSASLEAHHLQKTYGARKVVQDVSLSVKRGEVVGTVGPQRGGQDHVVLHDRGFGARRCGMDHAGRGAH